jgi:hypothetical protein
MFLKPEAIRDLVARVWHPFSKASSGVLAVTKTTASTLSPKPQSIPADSSPEVSVQ